MDKQITVCMHEDQYNGVIEFLTSTHSAGFKNWTKPELEDFILSAIDTLVMDYKGDQTAIVSGGVVVMLVEYDRLNPEGAVVELSIDPYRVITAEQNPPSVPKGKNVSVKFI